MWLKFIPYIAIFAFAFTSGLVFQSKVLNQKIVIPPCPAVKCPDNVSINLQDFDVTKIKVKTFTYAPSISGNITIVVDTATYNDLKK